MNELSHWHPILFSNELKRKPVPITLCGKELVAFRGSAGVGVLSDACPHRGARLSAGRVLGDDIGCPYHGWEFGPDGVRRAPGHPELEPHTGCLEAREEHGTIWVRQKGSTGSMPTFDLDGFRATTRFRMTMPGPLEMVVDLFGEAEHTGAVHWFGYQTQKMADVECRVDIGDDTLHVWNAGPQKRLFKLLRLPFGVKPSDRYVIEWTYKYSPVHARFEHYWLDDEDTNRGKVYMAYLFFIPIDDDHTEIFSWVYTTPGALWEPSSTPSTTRS
ncbi:MAG: Rieske 2Fe-2S domain-containing protein [Proteobacteria bacterium]|nr:Rieske 2Fe-2S domain-containing protein [Pseudomonadota bacterium]